MIGGRKAAQKNLAKDPNFYKNIGRIGGKNGHTGGFAVPILCTCNVIKGRHNIVNCAGTKGGRISKRKPNNEGMER